MSGVVLILFTFVVADALVHGCTKIQAKALNAIGNMVLAAVLPSARRGLTVALAIFVPALQIRAKNISAQK